MSQRLTFRVAEVQRAAQRLRWTYGLARLAIAAIGSVAAFGLLDFWVRPQTPAVRWLLSAGVFALWMWAFTRLVLPSLLARETLVAVAERIEQRYCQLNRQLSSAIAFLTQPDVGQAGGSLLLRRAVVAETEALADGLDFHSAIDGRQTARVTALAGLGLAAAALFAILAPATAGLAVQRLMIPWHAVDWPRNHELAFLAPPRQLAWGDDFEVTVIDRCGTLPDSVQMLFRYDSGDGAQIEASELTPRGERVVYRRDKVTRSFEYRVRGGDDDTMPWTRLTILEPPKLLELTVQVLPPAYTGLPPRTEGRVVKALVGSRVTIQGRFASPIHRAFIHSEMPQRAAPSVALSLDGLTFHAPADGSEWTVDRSGVLAFSFIDKEGLTFGRDTRVELQTIADSPPAIVWESPADPVRVTARAIVPIRGVVIDDLAVRRVQLRRLRSGASDAVDEGDVEIVELYAASDTAPARSADDVCEFDYGLDLSRLPDLVPGDVLLLRIQAEDSQPQHSSTAPRRLTIISTEELQSRIVARQAEILDQLAEALRNQRDVREQARHLETTLLDQRVELGVLDALQAHLHRQRQVQQLLGNHSSGAEAQLRALLDELANNRGEEQAIAQRLGELLSQTRTINEKSLPTVEQLLKDVLATVQAAIDAGSSAARLPDSASAAVAEGMRAATREQEVAMDALEQMVGTMAEWDKLARVAQELRQIAADQSQLIDLTNKLHLGAVTATLDFATAQRAPARQLAERQSELARRLDKWQTRLEELAPPPQGNAGQSFVAEARQLAIGEQMREAATQLGRLQLGQALNAEQRTAKSLQRLGELLQPKPELVGMATELKMLKLLQEEINDRTIALEANLATDPVVVAQRQQDQAALAREQGRLAEIMEGLLRRVPEPSEP